MAATTMAASSTLLVARVDIGNASVKSSRVLAVFQAAPVSAKVSCCVAEAEKPPVQQSRRAMLSLLAAAAVGGVVASEAKADALKIKVEGPPAPFGGLPGTDNADQARDTDAPLKERFYLQSLSPAEAIKRAKESAAQIVAVKGLIEKKAWPYVQNDLRSKAGYLRFDLTTVINSKPKEEKKQLTALANQLYDSIASLDFAARLKNVNKATASYDATVKLLDDLLTKAA